MVDIVEISAVVAAAGVLIGAVYYVLEMREQTRSRKTDLVMRLYDRFSSSEFQEVWHTFRTSDYEKYDDIFETPKELFMAINQVSLFFEGVGILLKRKLANIEIVDDLFGETVVRAWESAKMPIMKARNQLNDPESYYYFEYLYNEMKKRKQKLQQSKV